MKQLLLGSLLLASASALALGACSSESNPNPIDDGDSGTGGGLEGVTTGPEGVCPGTVRPTNDEFCHAGSCATEPSCSNSANLPVDSCCVLVGEPGAGTRPPLERTTDTNEFSDPSGAPPDLDCFNPASYPTIPADGQSKTATMTGVVESFASGCDLVGVKVEVFTVQRTGDPATDGLPDQLIGTAIQTDDTFPIEEEDVEKCTDPRQNRVYSYPDLPMYTELLIKTSSATATAGWADLYTYNVYITNDDPDYDATAGTYYRRVQALAQDDFQTIPTVAYGSTISPGNAAVGGEIHDCGNIRLQNASVDINLPKTQLVYFDDNETNPLPSQGQTQLKATGRTALYSALDVSMDGKANRPVRVAASGLIPGGDGLELVSLGYFDIQVFPNSVSSVTLRGVRAFQVQ